MALSTTFREGVLPSPALVGQSKGVRRSTLMAIPP